VGQASLRRRQFITLAGDSARRAKRTVGPNATAALNERNSQSRFVPPYHSAGIARAINDETEVGGHSECRRDLKTGACVGEIAHGAFELRGLVAENDPPRLENSAARADAILAHQDSRGAATTISRAAIPKDLIRFEFTRDYVAEYLFVVKHLGDGAGRAARVAPTGPLREPCAGLAAYPIPGTQNRSKSTDLAH
jgi:hypothetical protein